MNGIGSLSRGTYHVPTGRGHFYPNGGSAGYLIGDMDNVSIAADVQTSTRKSNETASRFTAFEYVTGVDGTVNLTFAQQDVLARAIAAMSFGVKNDQAAQAGLTMTVNVLPGMVIRTGYQNVTFKTFKSGNTVIPDILLEANSGSGFARVLMAPDGVVVDDDGLFPVTITFDVGAVDRGYTYGVLGGTGIRGTLVIEEDVLPGDGRIPLLTELWDVELRPTGENVLISGNDGVSTTQATGKLFPVSGKGKGFELGRQVELLAVA
jgi:hypothetical protein